MSERLPTHVICSCCGERTPIDNTRRYITLWAHPRAGGSLSRIEDQKAHDTYRCMPCIRIGRMPNRELPEQEVLL